MLSGFPQHPLWFEGRGRKGTAPWSHSGIQVSTIQFPHHLLEQESKNQDSWTDFVPKPVFCIACGQSGAFAFLKGYIYKNQEQDEQRIDYSAFSGKKKKIASHSSRAWAPLIRFCASSQQMREMRDNGRLCEFQWPGREMINVTFTHILMAITI